MSGIKQKGNNRNFEQAYPGCLGRMVNLFDLNIGVSANRLLSDKPHQDGSSLSRSRSAASRMSPRSDPIEEKLIASSFSNRKSNETTPVKMLIAQEMSGEMDSRKDPTNLVAKLMGLDARPRQEPRSAIQHSHVRGHPSSHSNIPNNHRDQQDRLFHYADPNEYKDVHEIWKQSRRSPHKGRFEEIVNDKRMALVRQKFIEAKRMSMDESLRQSNQFEDALEVLSSNKELFLQCLQEPNSMFSRHVYGRQSAHPPPDTKRITVLRPSKMTECKDFTGAGEKDGRQMKDIAFPHLNVLEKIHPGSSPPESLKYEETPESTRIVVLKPSHRKPQDDKAVGCPLSELPRVVQNEDFFGGAEDDLNQESREIAKAITQQMREKLGRHRRDETLISSVCSNGYVGDESSFSKSEIEDADGNLSDSEVMSPVSRHSWDYDNRLGSPYSSSFTRASCSPDSSVCREAKKRLSERWATMASTGSYQERHVRRGSSTLGEMLALSDTKKEVSPGEGGSSGGEHKNSTSELRIEENVDTSPRNLMRSKSLPVSSTEFGTRLNVGISVSDKGISESLKEDTKAKSVKSTIKWKVSNLFFSRNKKPVKDISLLSETKDGFLSSPGENCSNRTGSLDDKGSNHASPGLLEPSSKACPPDLISKQGIISPETECTVAKPFASGNLGDNQDQPSPVSVLEPPFEEDEQTVKVFPHYLKSDQHEAESSLSFIGSNLIDKSPPIGSIARTISWDDSCINTSSSHPAKESLTAQETDEEEQECFSFVKTLLVSLADAQSNSFLARWHSPESPLDPSLRDTCNDSIDNAKFHEAKKKQRRLIRKLLFDCVNAELADIAGYESKLGQTASPCAMVDELWDPMKVWFSGEVGYESDDCSLVVERVVIREVMGKGWNRHFRSEMDNFGKDLERQLLEELVREVVVELSGRL